MKILKVLIIVLLLSTTYLYGQSEVKPISWNHFKKSAPQDSASIILSKTVLNANKFMLGNWWHNIKKFDAIPQGRYLDFDGFKEHEIRSVTSEAECLAISLKLGIFDEKYVGVSKKEETECLEKLISSLANAHLVYTKKGWENNWKNALWIGQLASEAYLKISLNYH